MAKLVAQGPTNPQLAVELFVSVETVQFHLIRIYAKPGVRSRSELAIRYREGSVGRARAASTRRRTTPGSSAR